MKNRIKIAIRLIRAILFVFILSTFNQNESFAERAEKVKLEFVKDIPLPSGTVRFDYQTIDNVNRRLYISHMGANMVTVFDLDAQRVIANISNIPRPTGILAVPQMQRVYVSSSASDKVYILNSVTLKKVA